MKDSHRSGDHTASHPSPRRSRNSRHSRTPPKPHNPGGSNEGARNNRPQQSCAVILAYKDGEQHIKEQIESIYRQTHDNFHLYVFDDASRLPFEEAARRAGLRNHKTSVVSRERNLGYGANFLTGLSEAGEEHDYYAFSDQDDIWHEDKLQRAIEKLEARSTEIALYFSALNVVDDKGRLLHANLRHHRRLPCFANALVENVCQGNTIVMTRRARDLLLNTMILRPPVSHDRWVYLFVSGAGGQLIFDPQPGIDWRQHGSQHYGLKKSIQGRMRAHLQVLGGHQVRGIDSILDSLDRNRECLTPENRRTLDILVRARRAWLPTRIWGFIASGVHRQSTRRNLSLLAEVFLKKL